jgi:hypothetical protein
VLSNFFKAMPAELEERPRAWSTDRPPFRPSIRSLLRWRCRACHDGLLAFIAAWNEFLFAC